MPDVLLAERAKRLTAITQTAAVIEDFKLIKVLAATDIARKKMRAALNHYLWTCLSAAFPEQTFTLCDDMLKAYEADILRLPNITPNGLILPKQENIGAFNALQKEVAEAFAALGMGDCVARVQFPVNVRLQSGTPNQEVDSRPRASVKMHSDIWAGDPAGAILVFLSMLGDTAKAGIDFYEPACFPLSYVRPLSDYDDGKPVVDGGVRKLTSFHDKGWFLVDPFLIHQTTKKAPGYRISLDFRFISTHKVSSDSDEEDIRKPYFIPFAKWRELGSCTLIATQESIHQIKPKTAHIIGYPVAITLVGAHD